jgi:hypothetical protein
MEEQCRLQYPRDDIAPQDGPVKIVQLAGVLEGIGDERDQTKNVEVRGTGSGPAAEQDVDANAEVNERNQAQPVIQGAVRGNEDTLESSVTPCRANEYVAFDQTPAR